MENGPFIDGLPIKISIYKGFSMAMLNNQRVYIYIYKLYTIHFSPLVEASIFWERVNC